MSALVHAADAVTSVWRWAVLGALLLWVVGRIREGRVLGSLVRIHQELWLFAPPGLFMDVYRDWAGRYWFGMFFSLFMFVNWWFLRNWPDDNAWKKRGRKLRDKVRAVAGRLKVSPA